MHNHWIRFATFCKRDGAIDVKSHYCFFHAPISTLLTCISHFQTPFLYSLWIHFINYINPPNTLQNEDHCTRKKFTKIHPIPYHASIKNRASKMLTRFSPIIWIGLFSLSLTPILLFQTSNISQTIQNTKFYFF